MTPRSAGGDRRGAVAGLGRTAPPLRPAVLAAPRRAGAGRNAPHSFLAGGRLRSDESRVGLGGP